jgi:hypothetical protein
MDRTGCLEQVWYLPVKYVVYLLNRTVNQTLGWKTPIKVAFGDTPDISNLASPIQVLGVSVLP